MNDFKPIRLPLYIMVFVCVFGCKKNTTTTVLPDVTDLTAVTSSGQVILNWVRPSGANIAGYLVSYTPSGAVFSLSADVQSDTISKLTNGLQYTFTVKTKDQSGNLSAGASVLVSIGGSQGNSTVFNGNITFSAQADLDAFSAAYTVITGTVTLGGGDITDLSHLSNVDSIGGKLNLNPMPQLANLKAFKNLKHIGVTLYIASLPLLTDLEGLDSLRTIGKDAAILDMNGLTSLHGLEGLRYVKGVIYIGTESWDTPAKQAPNPKLTDFCGIKPLLAAGGLGDSISVANNASNPTVQQIISNCH